MAKEVHSTAGERSGFHFTQAIRHVCADMVNRLPELRHIDLSRVAVSFSQARKSNPYGLYASLTPMRFEGGKQVAKRRGRYYRAQVLRDEQGREMLYILSFCLPRFLNLEFREKLATVVHELWHIAPAFDGDIRRHDGRCHVHSASQRNYDAAMMRLAEQWLSLTPPPELYTFLRYRFDELRAKYGPVYGTRVARPKVFPIPAAHAVRLLAAESNGSGGEPGAGE